MRESTDKVHVRNIMKKLKATNRTQVAYLAAQLDESGGNARPNEGQANGKVLLTDSAHG